MPYGGGPLARGGLPLPPCYALGKIPAGPSWQHNRTSVVSGLPVLSFLWERLKIGVWDKLKDLFLDELLTRMTDYLHEKKRLDALENAFDCLEREFEVTYEGTIVSDGAFYECIKNCHILYRLIEYVENNTGRKQPADVFLSNVLSGMSAMTAPVRSMRRCKET